jgi:hypothetical protein
MTGKSATKFILLFFLLLQPIRAGADVMGVTVGIGPTQVNTTAQYAIMFVTNAGLDLGDQIFIDFPANTSLPPGFNVKLSVGGMNYPVHPIVSGQTLSLPVPVSIPPLAPISLQTDMVITNPSRPHDYQVMVYTTREPVPVASEPYTVTALDTPVYPKPVIITPNTICNPALYAITFTVDPAGALWQGSTVTIQFFSDEIVTNDSLANVTINGYSASTQGSSQTIVATLTDPVLITNSVTVLIPPDAVRNPSNPNLLYRLAVATSAQPTVVIVPDYSITTSAAPMTVNAVTVKPGIISNIAEYRFSFTTSPDGALCKGVSWITVTFPDGTIVPDNALNTTGLTLGHSQVPSATGSGGNTLTLMVPENINGGDTTDVVIPVTTGIRNLPVEGIYALSVSSNVQPKPGASSYPLKPSATPLAVSAVMVSPATIGNNAGFTFNFDTSSDGNLIVASKSQLVIVFPDSQSVPGGPIPLTGLTVGGNVVKSATGANGNQLTLSLSKDIPGGTPGIKVVIPASANIRNPLASGINYTLAVSTSVQTNPGLSQPYAIGLSTSPVAVGTVTVTPVLANNIAAYSLTVKTAPDGALCKGNGAIIITFPGDTLIPSGDLITTGLTVKGLDVARAVGSAGNVLTLTVPTDLPGGSSIDIAIPASVGIRNPSKNAAYTLLLSTSVEPSPVKSPPYSIKCSQTAVPVSVKVIPAIISNIAEYQITSKTSLDGPLRGGTSQMIVRLPDAAYAPNGSLDKTSITINNTPVDSAILSGNNTVTLTVHQDIPQDTAVAVEIPASAGIRNPLKPGAYPLLVSTSIQPTPGSVTYALGPSTATFAVGAVTVSPNTIGNFGTFNFSFSTSTDGCLWAGLNQIVVGFPGTAVVPDGALNANGLVINNIPVASAIGSDGNLVTLTIAQDIPGNSPAMPVVIPASARIRHPAAVGNAYQLTVMSSVQTTAGNSGKYSIGLSSAVLTVGGVTVSPRSASTIGGYNFPMTLSPDGELCGGVSQIKVAFPINAFVPTGNLNASGVTVNNVQVDSALGSNGCLLTLTVHQDIPAGTTIIVNIPATVGILNPVQIGFYHLTVATNVQASPGTSTVFEITLKPTPTASPTITVTVTPTITPYALPNNQIITYPSPARGDKLFFYYYVGSPTQVTIEIFNVMGEKAKEINENVTEAGYARTEWNIKHVAAGIYLYRVRRQTTSESTTTKWKKMVIVK